MFARSFRVVRSVFLDTCPLFWRAVALVFSNFALAFSMSAGFVVMSAFLVGAIICLSGRSPLIFFRALEELVAPISRVSYAGRL